MKKKKDRRKRRLADEFPLLLAQRSTVGIEHVDVHSEAWALDLATMDRPGRIAEYETGDDVGPAGNRCEVNVPLDAVVDEIETLGNEGRTR